MLSEERSGILSHPSSELTLSSVGRGGGVGNISTKCSDAEYCRILGEPNTFIFSVTAPANTEKTA